VTRDHALLAVELATRLGTTPALRAAFAPVVWRARAVLRGDSARQYSQSVLNAEAAGPRQEPAARSLNMEFDTVTELLGRIAVACQVSRRREAP
jgi:hypothetical protein